MPQNSNDNIEVFIVMRILHEKLLSFSVTKAKDLPPWLNVASFPCPKNVTKQVPCRNGGP